MEHRQPARRSREAPGDGGVQEDLARGELPAGESPLEQPGDDNPAQGQPQAQRQPAAGIGVLQRKNAEPDRRDPNQAGAEDEVTSEAIERRAVPRRQQKLRQQGENGGKQQHDGPHRAGGG